MTEPVTPNPQRYRWLKRLGFVFVIALLLLIGLRLWWGHRANARLSALVTEIQARGEPIHFDDMIQDPVPDDQNKAHYLRKALAQWPTVPGMTIRVTDTDWCSDPDSHPDPITDNPAYLAQLEPILTLLEQADAAPHCRWGIKLQSPVINFGLPRMGEQRRLARLINDAESRAAQAGDAALALRLIRLTSVLAQAVNADPPTLIGHLVGISINATGDSAVETLLPTLDIPADPKAPARTQAQRLLQQLTDETPIEVSMHNAWIGERWMAYDTTTSLLEQRILLNEIGFITSDFPDWMNAPLLAIFRPILVNDAVFQIRYYNNMIDTLEQETGRRAFVTQFNQRYIHEYGMTAGEYLEANPYLYPVSSWLTYIPSVLKTHYEKIATRRMTAVALAIKLYEADHGKRPDSLDQLIPDYLPAVPVDPFADGGSPIRYRPGGAILVAVGGNPGDVTLAATGPAIIYSVGYNGADNDGVVMVDGYDGNIDNTERYNDEHNNDMWFLLDKPQDAYLLDPAKPTEDQ